MFLDDVPVLNHLALLETEEVREASPGFPWRERHMGVRHDHLAWVITRFISRCISGNWLRIELTNAMNASAPS